MTTKLCAVILFAAILNANSAPSPTLMSLIEKLEEDFSRETISTHTKFLGAGGNAYAVLFTSPVENVPAKRIGKVFHTAEERNHAVKSLQKLPKGVAALAGLAEPEILDAPCSHTYEPLSFVQGKNCYYMIMESGGTKTVEECLDMLATLPSDSCNANGKTGRCFCRNTCLKSSKNEIDVTGFKPIFQCPSGKKVCMVETEPPQKTFIRGLYKKILENLQTLHDKQVAHGDFQTKNMMVDTCSLEVDTSSGEIRIPVVKFVDLDGTASVNDGDNYYARGLFKDFVNAFELYDVCGTGGLTLPHHAKSSGGYRDILTSLDATVNKVFRENDMCVADDAVRWGTNQISTNIPAIDKAGKDLKTVLLAALRAW